MGDDLLKKVIVLAFVGLVMYWGFTGFQPSGQWVAFLGPIILTYLFKPSNGDKPKKDKEKDNANDTAQRAEGGRGQMGGPSLYWDCDYLDYAFDSG